MQITVPSGWEQGRGCFGGLAVSYLARAMQDGEQRPLRSLNATLCGPLLVGGADLLISPLRIGSGVASYEGRIVQGDQVQVHAVGVFGKKRVEDGTWNRIPRPTPRHWREVCVVTANGSLGFPVFTQHYEFRPLSDPPFSGSTRDEVSGWVRPKDVPTRRDGVYLAMTIDAWWPAALPRFTSFRPIGTVGYLLQVLDDDVPETPLLFRATSQVARDGYMAEHRELWSDDGRLLAINDQMIAIIT